MSPDGRDALPWLVLALLTLGAAWLCALIVLPFVAPLTWAITLAVTFAPLHARLQRRIGQPWLTAALSTLVVSILVGAVLIYVGGLLAQQALAAAQSLQDIAANERWKSILAPFPWLEPVTGWIGGQLHDDATQGRAVVSVVDALRRLASGSLATAIGTFVTLFFLFYFLRDRRRFLQTIARLLPLAPAETRMLLRDVRDAIRAMVYGTLAVSAIQGALGGLMFWWLGLPAPLLWGMVMTVLSILPMVGAALVWGPTAIYLGLTGHFVSAAILAAWGAIVIGLVDNVLRPIVVKDRLHAHAVVVFVSVLGGVYAFGASGVMLGPIILAVTYSLLAIWQQRLARGDEDGRSRSA